MKKKKRYAGYALTPTQMEAIELNVLKLAEGIAADRYYVVDVALTQELEGRWVLGVYIETVGQNQTGVSLEDCRQLSHELDPLIEAEVKELADLPYNFEVSSPGLFRRLKKPRELCFYVNHSVELKQKGYKDPIRGQLLSFDPESNRVTIKTPEETLALDWNPKTVQLALDPPVKQVPEPDLEKLIKTEDIHS